MRITSSCLAAFTLLAAAGCSSTSTPRIVSADARGVSYQVASDRQGDARTAADEYCQARNATARLGTVTPTGNGRSTMSFTCV